MKRTLRLTLVNDQRGHMVVDIPQVEGVFRLGDAPDARVVTLEQARAHVAANPGLAWLIEEDGE
jgi:hypothetical protein